jgi:hypothetical protein
MASQRMQGSIQSFLFGVRQTGIDGFLKHFFLFRV